MYLRVAFCHVLLFGMALSSPVETKPQDKKLIPETTTQPPAKVGPPKNLNKEQVQSASNAQTEKPATKKRDIPEVLKDRNEYFDDYSYEGRSNDDYDINQALRAYLDNSRNENSLFDTGNKYRDDMLALAAYKQQQRLYNGFPNGRWTDINNSLDIPDGEIESDEVFNDRPENFFDRYYDQRYQNWANFPRTDKFITTRRRRSFLGNPKIPIYRRAVL